MASSADSGLARYDNQVVREALRGLQAWERRFFVVLVCAYAHKDLCFLALCVACLGAQAGGFVSAAGITPGPLGSRNGSVQHARNSGQSQEGALGPRLAGCVPRGAAPS